METAPLLEEPAKQPSKQHVLEYGALVTVAAVSLGAISVGVVLGYSSPAAQPLLASGLLSAAQLSVFESLCPAGAVLGAAGAGATADAVGRTRALALCCIPFTSGWLFIATAKGSAALFAGRLLTGVGVGSVLNIAPVYISEISPPSLRGALVGTNQLSLNIGIVLAFALGLFLPWRALAVCALVPLTGLLAAALIVPESPRWLVSAGRSEEAAAALRVLRGREDVGSELRSLQNSLAELEKEPQPTLTDFYSRRSLSRPLSVVLCFMFFQQASGINAVFFNVAPIFAAAGITNANLAALIVMAPQILVSAVTCIFIDSAGRRPMLLWATSLMSLASASLALALGSSARGINVVEIACLCLFVSAFCVGLGPVPWVLMGELFPPRGRGVASSMATALSNLCAFIVTVSFGPAVAAFGMRACLASFAVASAVAWAYTYAALPETKGKTLEEIQALMASSADPWAEESSKRT